MMLEESGLLGQRVPVHARALRAIAAGLLVVSLTPVTAFGVEGEGDAVDGTPEFSSGSVDSVNTDPAGDGTVVGGEQTEGNGSESTMPASSQDAVVDAANGIQAFSAGTVEVDPSMSSADIKAAFESESNSTIVFKAGEYRDMSFTVKGDKIVVPEAGVKFTYSSPKNAFVLSDGSSLTIGDGTPGRSIEIEGAANGIFSHHASADFVLAESSELWVHDSVSNDGPLTGNGISMNGEGVYSITAKEGSILKLTQNKAGIYTYGNEYGVASAGYGSIKATFTKCELVDLSGVKGKGNGSGFHQGDGWYVDADILFDGCETIRMNGNQTDAVCFNNGSNVQNLQIINCPNVEMKENGSWGTNGGYVTIKNSTVDISENGNDPWSAVSSTGSNLCCFELTVEESEINADKAGANCGVWVLGKSRIANSTISARKAGSYRVNEGGSLGRYESNKDTSRYRSNYPFASCNGFFFGGSTQIENSNIDASNCAGSGIVFGNGQDASAESTIVSSTIVANDNGYGPLNEKYSELADHAYIYKSGIAILAGTTKMDDCVASITGNEWYGVSYYYDDYFSGNSCEMIFDGETVCKVDEAGDVATTADAFAVAQNKDTQVLSGSLQANRENMSGSEGYVFNGVKADDVVYAAPINAAGTMLTRFDLHQDVNAEANLDSNTIEVYDPNGDSYEYVFRYNNEGEDLNAEESGNAYIWTPVTVVHYDATEGSVIEDAMGTAVEGDVALESTRGEGCAVGNAPVVSEGSYIDATDYTICGNSVQLSEGLLPQVQRDGYTFAGWFYAPAENEAEAAQAAAEGDYATLYSLATEKFDQTTKTNFGNDLGQVTVYAKWESNQPLVPAEPENPAAEEPSALAKTGDSAMLTIVALATGVAAAAMGACAYALRRRGMR